MRFAVFLFLIFFLAAFLRIIDLAKIPNGLQLDELNAGYQGYKIIRTGSDIFGNYLPLYINRFGDYRPAGVFYLAGISTYFFGLQTFFIRLPVAIIGSVTIFPLFWLTFLISKNKTISLLSAFLLAISPWHIVASRATSESLVALFCTITGICFFVYALQSLKKIFFLFSFLFLISSYFFYHTPRIFIPSLLFLLTVFFIGVSSKNKNVKYKSLNRYIILLFAGIFIITVGITFTKFGIGRFNQTSVFGNKDIQEKIVALQNVDQGNILMARIFHNKPVVFAKTIIDQYLSYFSTEYLYVKGGLPDRYTVDDMGLFYYVEFPILLIGLCFLAVKKSPYVAIPIFWLICGPLSAAITLEDSPNVQRSIFMLPAFQIIEAYGLFFSLQNIKATIRNTIIIIIAFIIALNMLYFFHMYFTHSPSHKSFLRNDGNEELFSYLSRYEKNYDRIYISSHEDLPMYYDYFSHNMSTMLLVSHVQYDRGIIHIGKYFFLPIDCPQIMIKDSDYKNKRALVIDSPTCQIDHNLFQTISQIERKDSTPAYIINKHMEHNI